MKKLLIAGLLLFPSISYADRLGSLKNNAEVLLSTQTAGGGYQLEPATVTIQAGQGITASTSVVTNGSSYSLIYNPEVYGYQLIQDIPLAMSNEVGWGFDQNGIATMRDTLWGDTGSLNSGYSIYLTSNATATGELPLRFRITRGGKIAFYNPNITNPIVEFNPIGNSSFTIPIVASSITAYGTITSTSGFYGDGSHLTGIVSGGGGASTLGVNLNGVSISSPTAQINFIGPGLLVQLGGTSTGTVSLTSNLPSGSTSYKDWTLVSLSSGVTGNLNAGLLTGLVSLSTGVNSSLNAGLLTGKVSLSTGVNGSLGTEFLTRQISLSTGVTGSLGTEMLTRQISLSTGVMGSLGTEYLTRQVSLSTGVMSSLNAGNITGLISLSTGVSGTLPPSNLVSTTAYTTDFTTDTFTFSISSGTGWANISIPGPQIDIATTAYITAVYGETMPSASTVTYSLEKRAFGSVNTSGTSLFTVTYTSACNTGNLTTALANATIDAGSSINLFTSNQGSSSGSPAWLRVTVFYKVKRN